MSLILTREIIAAAYDLLEHTEPFCRWNVPSSDRVKFEIVQTKYLTGQCVLEGPDYMIRISDASVGHLDTLLMTMAHEMVHVHMWHQQIREKDYHGPGFRKLAAQVCKVHGFDPKLF